MKKNKVGLLVGMMVLALVSCTASTTVLFEDEFTSLDAQVWSVLPSLTPIPGSEGSKTSGEVKVEDGMLKLSRYAPELYGDNPVSYIQTRNTVSLPDTYSVTMRFKNEYVGLGFGKLYVSIYNDRVWVGGDGIDGQPKDSFEYRSNYDSYFILSMHVTTSGYTIVIKEDVPNSTEETFSKDLDLSAISGDSIITIMGGSNTESVQYSEVDYIRISQ